MAEITEADKGIRQIRRDIERAENAGDADLFGKHLSREAAMRPKGGPHHEGIEDIVEFHRRHFETYDIDVEFEIEQITALGDLAIELGTYSATLTPADGSDTREGGGDYLYVYERDSQGDWKILRMSW